MGELAVLVPYLFEIDPEVFNPVQQNLEDFYFVLEKTLKENQIDKDTIDEVLKNLKEYLWPTFLGSAVESGVYALCCLLMMIGASCQVRGLMVPYLILQMIVFILDPHRRRSYPWPLLRQCNRRRDRRSHRTHCVRSFTLLLDGCSTSLCGVGQQRLHVQSCPDQANDTIQRWTWVLPSNLSSAFPNGRPKMTCF